MSVAQKTWHTLRKIPLVLVLLAVFVLGYLFSSAVHESAPERQTPAASGEAAATQPVGESQEIWTCSMHPQIRLPEPGQCPICGMDLIPAEQPAGAQAAPAEAGTAKAKAPKYACSMFCVPPLPKPGKCPVCGMEMVEVEVETTDATPPRTLTLSPAAEQLAQVRTAPVERKFVEAEIRMVGKIDYDESRLRYITAWVPGRLERLYVDYTGVPVQKGEHLVHMYSPELATAQTELLEALKRVRETEPGAADQSMVNERARDWAEDIREKFRLWGLTDEQIAEIEQRGTPSEYMTIYAPSGGIVIEKSAVEGMYVDTGTRIYTIADLSRVWLLLDAYKSDLTWLRYGQKIAFTTEAYPGETFRGQIAFIDPVLDEKTRTVNLRVNVDNSAGRLKPGMFAHAVVRSRVAAGGRVMNADLAGKWLCSMHPEVVRDEPGACPACGMPLVRAESLGFVSVEEGNAEAPLVIPASAPLITGKRAVVYVAVPDHHGAYQGREIVLGPRAGDDYIVREGLVAGEQVVVRGNFKIDSAMQIQAEPSMMNPADEPASAAGPDDGQPASADDAQADAAQADDGDALPAPRADLDKGSSASLEVPEAARAQLADVFTEYLAVHRALSQDTLPPAKQAAGRLANQLADVAEALPPGSAADVWAKERPGIAASAKALANADDIAGARLRFALLSESMIAVARRLGTGGDPLHRIHCPMAFEGRGADWLQPGKRVENPYFGAAMFRCGTTVATYGQAEAEADAGGAHE